MKCLFCGQAYSIRDDGSVEVVESAIPSVQTAWSKCYGLNSGSWFSGRARRSEYWKRMIFLYLVAMFVATPMIAIPITSNADRETQMSGGAAVILLLGCLLLLICWIAMWPITVRRLHDRDMSGWWILWFTLLSLIPYVGWVVSIVQFVVVGCMDGTPGPNKYGPDPKGRDQVPLQRSIISIVNNNTNTVNTGPCAAVEERLKKLDELKEKGVLSMSEYEDQRKQIISAV